jgi:hypothetical protein
MILDTGDEKERINELSDSQNADRTKMNEEDCMEYNEKVMMQEEVIDYKEVMLEGEVHQIQKNKNSRRKEIIIVLPSERPSTSEMEETNSERNEENSEKRACQHPIEWAFWDSCLRYLDGY